MAANPSYDCFAAASTLPGIAHLQPSVGKCPSPAGAKAPIRPAPKGSTVTRTLVEHAFRGQEIYRSSRSLAQVPQLRQTFPAGDLSIASKPLDLDVAISHEVNLERSPGIDTESITASGRCDASVK